MWLNPILLSILVLVCISCEMVYGSIVEPFHVPQYSIKGVSARLDDNLDDFQWPRGNRRLRRYHPKCDVAAKSGFCFNDGKHVIVPNVSPSGILASYSFEENVSGVLFDSTGNGNHGIAKPLLSTRSSKSGMLGKKDNIANRVNNPLYSPSIPTVSGRNLDKAGAFNGKLYYQVAPSDSLKSIELTNTVSTSMWFYLADAIVTSTNAAGCPFFQFGIYSLYLTPDAYIGVSIEGQNVVVSHSRVILERWTSIAITYNKDDKMFELYINGMPDVTIPCRNLGIYQYTKAFIGGIKNTQCLGATYYIDDVIIRNTALTPSLIAATAFTALGSNEAAYAHLACGRNSKCGFTAAQSKCMSGYHLCSQRELATGAYNIARLQGWLKYDDKLWVADDIEKFAFTYQHSNKVEAHSEKLFGGKSDMKKNDVFDVEDAVFGEDSKNSRKQREIQKSIAAETARMNVEKMALCCAVKL